MNNMEEKVNNSIVNKSVSLNDVMEGIEEIQRQNKIIGNTLKLMLNSDKVGSDNSIHDSLNVLVNKVDLLNNKMSDLYDPDELTGKQVYDIREKTGISWNQMEIKYGIPKSTLQYRMRQWKRKKLLDLYDTDDYE